MWWLCQWIYNLRHSTNVFFASRVESEICIASISWIELWLWRKSQCVYIAKIDEVNRNHTTNLTNKVRTTIASASVIRHLAVWSVNFKAHLTTLPYLTGYHVLSMRWLSIAWLLWSAPATSVIHFHRNCFHIFSDSSLQSKQMSLSLRPGGKENLRNPRLQLIYTLYTFCALQFDRLYSCGSIVIVPSGSVTQLNHKYHVCCGGSNSLIKPPQIA